MEFSNVRLCITFASSATSSSVISDAVFKHLHFNAVKYMSIIAKETLVSFYRIHSLAVPKRYLFIIQVTFLTFGMDDIHQNHEMIENHIFI